MWHILLILFELDNTHSVLNADCTAILNKNTEFCVESQRASEERYYCFNNMNVFLSLL